MATLTSNASIASTGLKHRGAMIDLPYTGSIVIRTVAIDCDGSLILYYDDGKLVSQFYSTKRLLTLISDTSKIVYSTDKTTIVEDKSPIALKPGIYYARFYPGSSAYYTHAAIRGSCCGGWCVEPCDKIWTVTSSSSIQSIHESEKNIPDYDDWIPTAYYIGIYGQAMADQVANGELKATENLSGMFTSKRITSAAKLAAATKGTATTSGGGGTPTTTNISADGYSLLNVTTDSEKYLDFSTVDFCQVADCDLPTPTAAKQAPTCSKCGGITEPTTRPTTIKKCNCNH